MGIEVEEKNVESQMAEVTRQEELAKARFLQENGVEVEDFEELEAAEPVYKPAANKEKISATAAKAKFVESIYSWLIATLKKVGNGDYKDMFTIEGSSIMCNLPSNYFSRYEIPEGMRIEMKFIKKG